MYYYQVGVVADMVAVAVVVVVQDLVDLVVVILAGVARLAIGDR